MSDMSYRKELDGVRAIAVLSVILFHVGYPDMTGGYIGVDIFFVLSGYLICGQTYMRLEAGTYGFSLQKANANRYPSYAPLSRNQPWNSHQTVGGLPMSRTNRDGWRST